MKVETINEILARQHTYIEFKDGKVNYFSISTQHGTADTIVEAIDIIITADKDLEGMTVFNYFASKVPATSCQLDDTMSNEDWSKLKEIYYDVFKKNFEYK